MRGGGGVWISGGRGGWVGEKRAVGYIIAVSVPSS